jgi:hypothetical protein
MSKKWARKNLKEMQWIYFCCGLWCLCLTFRMLIRIKLTRAKTIEQTTDFSLTVSRLITHPVAPWLPESCMCIQLFCAYSFLTTLWKPIPDQSTTLDKSRLSAKYENLELNRLTTLSAYLTSSVALISVDSHGRFPEKQFNDQPRNFALQSSLPHRPGRCSERVGSTGRKKTERNFRRRRGSDLPRIRPFWSVSEPAGGGGGNVAGSLGVLGREFSCRVELPEVRSDCNFSCDGSSSLFVAHFWILPSSMLTHIHNSLEDLVLPGLNPHPEAHNISNKYLDYVAIDLYTLFFFSFFLLFTVLTLQFTYVYIMNKYVFVFLEVQPRCSSFFKSCWAWPCWPPWPPWPKVREQEEEGETPSPRQTKQKQGMDDVS